MFLAYSKNTERGAAAVLAERLRKEREEHELERAERLKAQRAAWDAEMRVIEAKKAREEELKQARLLQAEERKRLAIRYRHSFKDIERRACRLFKVAPSELRSQRRHRDIVFARQFVMYWATRLTALSLPQIGRLLDRDHTTILSGKNVYPQKRAKMGRHLRAVR